MRVFKVVLVSERGFRSLVAPKRARIYYRVGERSVPKVGGLLGFDTLGDAIHFAIHHRMSVPLKLVVLEGVGEDVTCMSRVSTVQSMSGYRRFWGGGSGRLRSGKAHSGSVMCSAFTPTRVVWKQDRGNLEWSELSRIEKVSRLFDYFGMTFGNDFTFKAFALMLLAFGCIMSICVLGELSSSHSFNMSMNLSEGSFVNLSSGGVVNFTLNTSLGSGEWVYDVSGASSVFLLVFLLAFMGLMCRLLGEVDSVYSDMVEDLEDIVVEENLEGGELSNG